VKGTRRKARIPSRRRKFTASLRELERGELVRALQKTEYVFKHALVQDTAYQSLLKNERKVLHRAIGDALERLYDTRVDEFSAELAHHFEAAGDDARTFTYAERAGDRAAHVFAYPEAGAHYQDALEALTRLPNTPERRRARVDLIVKKVAVSLRTQGPEASLQQLRAAENLLGDLRSPDDRVRWARVHFWMGDAYSHLNQQREAIAYLQRVLDVAKEGIADETLLAIPSNVIGRALVAQGKFDQAQPLLEQAAPLLEKSANWYEWVLAVGFLGFSLAAQGETDAGLEETQRAFTRAQALGTPLGVADSHVFASFICMQRGDYTEMLEHAEEGLEKASRIHDHLLIFVAHSVVAWAHTRLGRLAQAERHFMLAHEIAAHTGGQLFFADMFQAAYAEQALRQGDLHEAAERARRAVDTARNVGSVFSEGLAQRVWGQAIAGQDPAQARERLAASVQLFEAGNARVEAARSQAALDEMDTIVA
jgi:tetratricopeptide (TPR) repeat protein